MSFQQRLECAWYGTDRWVYIFAPLTLLFALISGVRRWAYQAGILKSSKPPVPVIVVGNISVGGNGKTPVVLAIAEYLTAQGFQVGVLSRGYGGTQTQFPYLLKPDDQPALVGDEPALLARRLATPVVIDPRRARGANHLYELGCDVIVCDDGLQHYALGRDIEWIVMDERQLGNGLLLPMGPLREGPARLKRVNGIVLNGDFTCAYSGKASHSMTLAADSFVNVADSSKVIAVDQFITRYNNVDAICAIGNPRRFYTTLERVGVTIAERKSFADHHQYVEGDIPQHTVVMTEKDAVKCHSFAHQGCWYLRVNAQLPEEFYTTLLAQVREVE
ncbi:tetraacyldisaccharide 4'-kinase [Alteromonas sp. ASW11-36]|uniref:Tetraacyldisaccharide 4'-kinase n=1 Tax=Alteromonas arenosi TaxID=3055817 RepID=A0ABT7SWU9_9ALTE|nr:tetraacyldisaccharide 4'-kinase [Alteromonas sp. ASW11-36]MDM7860663.1 tetraacyldisaccharide 4'-kinase [Alteromonas sp. ASW11-36]